MVLITEMWCIYDKAKLPEDGVWQIWSMLAKNRPMGPVTTTLAKKMGISTFLRHHTVERTKAIAIHSATLSTACSDNWSTHDLIAAALKDKRSGSVSHFCLIHAWGLGQYTSLLWFSESPSVAGRMMHPSSTLPSHPKMFTSQSLETVNSGLIEWRGFCRCD